MARIILGRRAALGLLAAGAGLRCAAAQNAAPRQLTLVVPATPGGTTDIAARLAADGLGQRGRTAVVENRPGGNGAPAAITVARGRADGSLLFVGFSGFMSAIPALTPDLGVDTVRDLLPLAMLMDAPHLLVVPAALPVRTLGEFIALARERGGRMNYASVGVGSVHHLGVELMKQRAGIAMEHIPYRGAAPAIQDLLAGRVQLLFNAAPAVAGFLRDGQLRALAVAAPARLPSLPEVLTTAEAGLPGFVASSWYALFAPAGTPRPVLDALTTEVYAVTATDAFRRKAEEQGAVAEQPSPAEMTARIERELAEWRALVRSAGIRAE
jgi:tripartite-type tricarboxylate transporter receptor subunit TctC